MSAACVALGALGALVALGALGASTARADSSDLSTSEPASAAGDAAATGISRRAAAAGDLLDDGIADQSIGAQVGIASGGRVTPGGVRVTGHYLYQMSDQDWFDGTASFTFGSSEAACFRDRMDDLICQHGLADGGAIELAAGVRRIFPSRGTFRPFARAAIGIGLVRFGNDDLTGFSVPFHAGVGLRARVSSLVAITALADLTIGFARFGRGLGSEPQVGLSITAGAEFRLK